MSALRVGAGGAAHRSWALLVVRALVGGYLVYSGWVKAVDPVEFLKLVRLYELTTEPFLLNLVAGGLPWFEVFCGLLLLLGVGVRGTALVVSLLLIAFTAVVWQRALGILEGGELAFCAIRFDCGCGAGEVAVCRKLVENGILIGLGLWLMVGRPSRWALSDRLPGLGKPG
jgi:uncharacterized membrane protein YphA (DoxX/SURF4 family)